MSHDILFDAQGIIRPIVLACDGSYAMQLATVLVSAVEANRSGQPLDVYVLCEQFPVGMRQRVVDSVPEGSTVIHWVPVDLSSFEGLPTMPHISSRMAFARLMIPRIFSTNVHRVLYLDADTLVLDDLIPLWEVDLKGAVIGAVLDRILDPALKRRVPGVDKWLDSFPRVRDYFNNGVLLIDLDAWRKERISEKAIEYLRFHPDSPYNDQDALNVACDGRWTELGLRWNFYDHFRTSILDMPPAERPKIAHFVGSQKPWKASALSVNADLYEVFRGRTRFARTTVDKLRDVGSRTWSLLKRHLLATSLGPTVRSMYSWTQKWFFARRRKKRGFRGSRVEGN